MFEKFRFKIVFFSSLLALFLISCSPFNSNVGTIDLRITDAPIADSKNVEGVFITVDSISFNLNGKWYEDENFNGPKKFNLLDLTQGKTELLSNIKIKAGEISQIRFKLKKGINEEDESKLPYCYISIDKDSLADDSFEDNINYELSIPSGFESGFKANGPFIVPSNSKVEIIADFDVRKSIIYSGNKTSANGEYKLKPTIRLIVKNQAGEIRGLFNSKENSINQNYVIFVYESGTYLDSEELYDDSKIAFSNAVTSCKVTEDSYYLPFLAPSMYDLIITTVNDDGIYSVIDKLNSNINVKEKETTVFDINLN